ncbi:MAG: mevalonate kinase [Caldilineaceae bacterium]
MPPVTATAPGKVILLGEHAVVYGRPAIAAPVWQTVATATIRSLAAGQGCTIVAADLDETVRLQDGAADQPLALVARLALAELGIDQEPDWQIELHSTIPIASGMGSGAALSTALVRALFAQVGRAAEPPTVSRIVYESERIYHGTPSGIDNTVIAYGMPIWFVRGQPAEAFVPPVPFTLAIADSGIRSPTKETVGDVRRDWGAQPARYEALFDAIATVVHAGRKAIAAGDLALLGEMMDEDHALLAQLGVSSDSLERLVAAARAAGALGAKLSGGGRGGNVIALVQDDCQAAVEHALLAAGAVRVISTTVAPAAQ